MSLIVGIVLVLVLVLVAEVLFAVVVALLMTMMIMRVNYDNQTWLVVESFNKQVSIRRLLYVL